MRWNEQVKACEKQECVVCMDVLWTEAKMSHGKESVKKKALTITINAGRATMELAL